VQRRRGLIRQRCRAVDLELRRIEWRFGKGAALVLQPRPRQSARSESSHRTSRSLTPSASNFSETLNRGTPPPALQTIVPFIRTRRNLRVLRVAAGPGTDSGNDRDLPVCVHGGRPSGAPGTCASRVKPISRSQRNGRSGTHSGPCRDDCSTPALRPIVTFTAVVWYVRSTSTRDVALAQLPDIRRRLGDQRVRPVAALPDEPRYGRNFSKSGRRRHGQMRKAAKQQAFAIRATGPMLHGLTS
jgi:hypothetical protein